MAVIFDMGLEVDYVFSVPPANIFLTVARVLLPVFIIPTRPAWKETCEGVVRLNIQFFLAERRKSLQIVLMQKP